MSTLVVDNLKSPNQQEPIPISELQQRTIKTYRNVYTGGGTVLSTSYTWITAAFADYTPARSDTRIRFSLSLSICGPDAHAIGHFIFYANNVEQGRHNISMNWLDQRHLYVWDVASWGTTQGRIGYQGRSYSTGNEVKVNSTRTWNGGGADQAAHTNLVIEEYLPI